MKLINWVQFTWDLGQVPEAESNLPEHYEITAASGDDEKELRRMITSSFALDPEWNPTMNEVMQTIDGWLGETLQADATSALVLRHGVRIIGASILSPAEERENHLCPGPCLLMEYRNRGFGTILLERSLQALRAAGLSRAIGVAKENSPVTKFLYPKFGGVPSPREAAGLLAA